MKFLLAVFALLISSACSAVTLHLTADAPTQREDGTPFDPATEIATYKLYHTIPGTSGTVEVTEIPAPDYWIETNVYGVHKFGLSVVDTMGIESRQALIDVPVMAPPAAPTYTKVTVERCDSSTGDCIEIAIINSN